MLDDHYTILGIHRNATPEEIHDAYLAVAKTCHPDTNPDDPEAAKKFVRAQAAYDVLSNHILRAKYDRTSVSYATVRNGKTHARPASTATAPKKTPQPSDGKVIKPFYRDRDRRVSRQLSRSEFLWAIGYLAALLIIILSCAGLLALFGLLANDEEKYGYEHP